MYKEDILLATILVIAILVVSGIFYGIFAQGETECKRLGSETGLPSMMDGGECYIKVRGVWTPEKFLAMALIEQ